jgi:RNA polymerase sigma factor (TIGR02999 family)
MKLQTGSQSSSDVLAELRRAPKESLDQLVPVLYRELRSIAHHQLVRRERAGSRRRSLETTALVNEAYLRLVGRSRGNWNDRAHFLAIAAVAMRHLLIERARARRATKRGGDVTPISLDEDAVAVAERPEALLEIEDALQGLARVDPRLARVVECRFYGGMSEEEIAAALGLTVRTVQRDWSKARMLLKRALEA